MGNLAIRDKNRGALSPVDPRATEEVRKALTQECSESTRKAYAADWASFKAFCERHSFKAIPAEESTIALFLAESCKLEGMKLSSIKRRFAAIRYVHRVKGHMLPTLAMVNQVLRGWARTMDVTPKQVKPLLADDLSKICAGLGSSLREKRDKALLLVGWHGALRSVELAKLDLKSIKRTPGGIVLHIRRKTFQREEARVPIGRDPLGHCPVAALESWLVASGIKEGPVFRRIDWREVVDQKPLSRHSVGWLIRQHLVKVGLDPKEYCSHSLRAGLVTSASAAGKAPQEIQTITGHHSLEQLSKYVRYSPEQAMAVTRGLVKGPSKADFFKRKALELAGRGMTPRQIAAAFARGAKVKVKEETIAGWVGR